jgi:hypothetical protein
MISQKEALVLAISSMDIEDVKSILSSRYRYQDASKDVYVNKLFDLFSEYKSFGDNRFIVKNGCCNYKKCNFGCSGYSFVGNVSKNYFNLILSETKNEVSEIDYCHDFKIDELSEHLNKEIKLEILTHETVMYSSVLSKHQVYLGLIALGKDNVYSIDKIKHWLSTQNYNDLGKEPCMCCGGLICLCGFEKIEGHLKDLYDELNDLITCQNKGLIDNNLVIHNNINYYKIFIEELNNLTLLIKI